MKTQMSIISSSKTFMTAALGYLAVASFCVASYPDRPVSIENNNSIEPEIIEVSLPMQPETNTFHVIEECVKITLEEGVFHYKSRGVGDTCGLYLVTDPDKSITITVDYLDAQCHQGGLISIVDGWELNGQVFPSVEDHEKSMESRFHDLCVDPRRRHRMRKSFTSSQNVALIQYRIPTMGQGFSIRIQHVPNPRPCNILVQDSEAIFTLQNFGRSVNCSLTTLFDAKIRMLYMSTGLHGSKVKFAPKGYRTETYHKCGKMGLEDYVQIGGSSGLDTSKMQVIEEFCGYEPHPRNKYVTVFCGMTTIRLVSSGKFQNKIVTEVRRADIEDIDSADFFCDLL